MKAKPRTSILVEKQCIWRGTKRATRSQLLNMLRNLYGDLTTDGDDADGGAILMHHIAIQGVPIDNVLVLNRKLKPHLRAISKMMNVEDEHRGAF